MAKPKIRKVSSSSDDEPSKSTKSVVECVKDAEILAKNKPSTSSQGYGSLLTAIPGSSNLTLRPRKFIQKFDVSKPQNVSNSSTNKVTNKSNKNTKKTSKSLVDVGKQDKLNYKLRPQPGLRSMPLAPKASPIPKSRSETSFAAKKLLLPVLLASPDMKKENNRVHSLPLEQIIETSETIQPVNRCLFNISNNLNLIDESIILIDSSTDTIASPFNIKPIKNVKRDSFKVKESAIDRVSCEDKNITVPKQSLDSNTSHNSTIVSFNDTMIPHMTNSVKRRTLLWEKNMHPIVDVGQQTFDVNQSGIFVREHTFTRDTPNRSGSTNEMLPSTNANETPIIHAEIRNINETYSTSPKTYISSCSIQLSGPNTPLSITETGLTKKSLFTKKTTSTPQVVNFATPVKTPNIARLTRAGTPYTRGILNDSKADSPQPTPRLLNRTHSVEKPNRRRSMSVPNALNESKRNTRVTFCSPVNILRTPERKESKRRTSVVERSILKGSNHTAEVLTPSKRMKISQCMLESINRLSKPRTTTKYKTPIVHSGVANASKSIRKNSPLEKSSFKNKMPNFAAVHAHNFAQMESLVDVVNRKKSWAMNLAAGVEKSALKPVKSLILKDESTNKTQLKLKVIKPVPQVVKAKEGFTRFGFRNKNARKENQTTIRPTALNASKNKVDRKDLYMARPEVERNPTRKILAGVRLNKRFELLMKCRNIDLEQEL